MLSSSRREGTTEYASNTLECNWQEERSRENLGETVKLSLMKGSVVRPEEPDISIAPPTRVQPSDTPHDTREHPFGQLLMPHRMRRSRTTNDSSRQGADDGFREYTSMSQTFFAPPEQRETCPVSTEAYFHGTWGGPVQLDGRTKTRVGIANRSKNSQFEKGVLPDGEAKLAKKMVSVETYNHASQNRPSSNTSGGFGSVVPRHLPTHAERMLESTAMASWR